MKGEPLNRLTMPNERREEMFYQKRERAADKKMRIRKIPGTRTSQTEQQRELAAPRPFVRPLGLCRPVADGPGIAS